MVKVGITLQLTGEVYSLWRYGIELCYYNCPFYTTIDHGAEFFEAECRTKRCMRCMEILVS